jgi:hypothetical protein
MSDQEVIFDGSEDIEDWDSINSSTENADFNDYDLEFIDMDEVEEGDYWVGEFTGIREIGGVENAIFDVHEEEISYGFTPHAILRDKLEEVEEGDTVAVVYDGTVEIEDQANDAHVWDVRTPPE